MDGASDDGGTLDERASIEALEELSVDFVEARADDANDVRHLRESADRLATFGTLTLDSRENLAVVAELLGAVEVGVLPAESTFEQIGDLIEAAGERMRDGSGIPEPPRAAAPPPPPPTAATPVDDAVATRPDFELPDGIDVSLVGEFYAQTGDEIEGAEAALLSLEASPDDMEAVNTVFRAFHTIKGMTAYLALDELTELCHLAENVISPVRNGEETFGPHHAGLALRACDVMRDYAEVVNAAVEGALGPRPEGFEPLRDELRALADGATPAEAAAAAAAAAAGPAEASAAPGAATRGPSGATAGATVDDSAPEGIIVVPDEFDPNMFSEFAAETKEWLEGAEAALLRLEANPSDDDAVDSVFRAFHSIKGMSAYLNLDLLTQICHLAEDSLAPVRAHDESFSTFHAELALRSCDCISELVEGLRITIGGATVLLPPALGELSLLCQDPRVAALGSGAGERLGALLAAHGVQAATPAEGAVPAAPTRPQIAAPARTRDTGTAARAQRSTTKSSNAGGGGAGGRDSTVRVSTGRLDELITMIGELVIAHTMVAQDPATQPEIADDLHRKVAQCGKIVRELQDLSMTMRMVPLRSTFQKMARAARDLGVKIGKPVDFSMQGDETEIDRNMVDLIHDPLMHMVRNAVDHGIEPAEVRLAAGKPADGQLFLASYPSGGNVVIELHDDGGGLNRAKILDKARSLGLADANRDYTDPEVWQFLFEPGFSTADKVTDVSGRGVGLDVVRKNIEALNGRIEVSSETGRGTIFTFRLPLTLAITDGMLVQVGDERFVIPTIDIRLTFRPEAEQLTTIGGRGEIVLLRGEAIPLHRLGDVFEVPGAEREPTRAICVILDTTTGPVALLVDDLLGQQQVVAKSLGRGLGKVAGIAGAAIMGDGRVALIVDTDELVHATRSTAGVVVGAASGAAILTG